MLKTITCDNAAVMAGYTEQVIASCDECDLFLLVKPDADYDDSFLAFDTDNQEMIRVHGWLFSIEPSV